MSDQKRKQYHDQFRRYLAQLNARQREAVDQLEGPLLVLAGPGTGKTQLLSARVGNILLQTDTQAHNILCLTFTDAGVQAMRRRLLQLIGPEGHRVPVFTFHSFCNSVIQDNLEYFGHRNLIPLSELERIELIRDLLDALPHDHPLRAGRSDPYFYERHLTDLFRKMKSENWSVEGLHTAIEAYLEELPTRPEYQYKVNRGAVRKGDPKTSLIEQETLRMDLLRQGSRLFTDYERLLRQRRRYDYEDMIRWVVQGFEREEGLLRTYQERFLYIVVDEFQDTNGAQNRILRQLADYWEAPNLFIVGDDDQSIYEFQGARLHNLLDFRDRYRSSIEVVLLEENYRSSQPILEAATSLIGQNYQRLSQQLNTTKQLIARHPVFADTVLRPLIVEYPNTSQETAGVLRQLQQWQQEGIPWGDMAVIYARHRQARSLARLLDKQQIPYQTKRQINILDTPLIRQLREIMEYVLLELQRPDSGAHLLFRLLHFRCFDLPPADLALLSLEKSAHAPELPWRRWLRTPSRWPVGLIAGRQLQRVADWLDEMIGQAQEMPLPELVERLFNGSGLLKRALAVSDSAQQVQVAQSFFTFLRAEADRRPRLDLARFLDVLNRMDDNHLGVPLQRQADLSDAVTLVTAHSAKGLEFRAVVLLDAVAKEWDPGRQRSGRQFRFPDTLTYSGAEDELEARRRLFYVAMTRAKERLHISFGLHNGQSKQQQRSQFVDELLEAGTVDFQQRSIDPEDLFLVQVLDLQEMPAASGQELDRQLVDERLQQYRLSVSDLHRYLYCPLGFYYEVVLRAPHVQSEAATYGLALHQALQRLFDRMMAQEDRRFPEKAELLEFFEQEMERLRAYFRPERYRQRLQQGRQNLARFYDQQHPTWPDRVRTEQLIRHAEIDGVPLKGVIDRLDWVANDRIHVVDYKTGSHQKRKWQRPTERRPEGGSYWRQLVFYKLLYENQAGATERVTKGSIVYLDPDAEGVFPVRTITFQRRDIEQLRTILREVYDKIQQHQFYEGCGKPECVWCRFLREDLAVESFTNQEVEELDD